MEKSEKEILNIIRYLPVVLILLISALLTFYLYTENNKRFKKENEKLEAKYITINKELIQFQVENIKNTILYQKAQQEKKLKKQLKTEVQNAYKIAMSIYNNNKNKSEEEVSELIKDALREIRFNDGRGYFFIYKRNGVNILHPIKPKLENVNLWNYQDKKGTFLLQKMNEILKKKKDTYSSWFWTKPEDITKEYEKLGYFKLFEPFDWFIGTGEYLVDFENDLKKDLSSKITNFRYKKDGYIFVIDFDGNYLSYHNKDVIGKNVRKIKIANDVEDVLNKLVQLANNEGGFLSYTHKDKPLTNQEISKISYVVGIKDWQWIVGTGFYMDDFYLQLKSKKNKLNIDNSIALQKILIISFLFTVFLLLVFFYISSILESRFISYKKSIRKQINDNIKKDNILAHQSKMAAMGEMIGNIAHQWRQPLSTISTIVTGVKAQREMGIKDEKLENESLDTINKHVQYLSHTIDDFRNFFDSQKEAKDFKIEVLFEKTLNLIYAQFKSKDIQVIKDIDTGVVNSLENELIQVLINILNNARDELLKIKDKKFIFISAKIKKENLIIKIKDNAGGIDSSIMNRIFEPYFTTKRQDYGTGIGLYMSEEIVVKHLKGKIKARTISYDYESNYYTGAEFVLILPLKSL